MAESKAERIKRHQQEYREQIDKLMACLEESAELNAQMEQLRKRLDENARQHFIAVSEAAQLKRWLKELHDEQV